jgi:hypothetical protein
MRGDKLSVAAALLDKAKGTQYDAEKHALALRAYTLVAAYLNEAEAGPAGGRQRDRRLLDRRRDEPRPAEPTGRTATVVPPAYRWSAAAPPVGRRGRIDLTA